MNGSFLLDILFPAIAFIYLLNALYIAYRYIREKQTWKIYTILYLTSYAIILINAFLYFRFIKSNDFYILSFCVPVLFTLTASAYLATRVVVYPDYKYTKKNLFHFAAPLIALAGVVVIHNSHDPASNPTDSSSLLVALCFFNILYYQGYQIIEASIILLKKPELIRGKLHKNTLTMFLVLRSLNIGLPVLLFIEIHYEFTLVAVKLTAVFLALNSLMLTYAMGIYSYFFKVPRARTSDLPFDLAPLPESGKQNQNIKNRLFEAMNKDKIFTNEKLTISDLAKSLEISPRTLSEYINKNMNTSFPEYLANLRIEEAKRLFSDTDMSVAEVTYTCGFSSASKFYEHFKKITGYPPAQFKKMAAKNKISSK